MTALTSNKEEQRYTKLIALIGEWEAEEISEVLAVTANSKWWSTRSEKQKQGGGSGSGKGGNTQWSDLKLMAAVVTRDVCLWNTFITSLRVSRPQEWPVK